VEFPRCPECGEIVLEAEDPLLLRRTTSPRQQRRLLLTSRALAWCSWGVVGGFGVFVLAFGISSLAFGGHWIGRTVMMTSVIGWGLACLGWLVTAGLLGVVTPLRSWAARVGLPVGTAASLAVATGYLVLPPWSTSHQSLFGAAFAVPFALTIASLAIVNAGLWHRTRDARYHRGARVLAPRSTFTWLAWVAPVWAGLAIARAVVSTPETPSSVRGMESMVLLFCIIPATFSGVLRVQRALREELATAPDEQSPAAA
jgi:hypothetical protein